jgi:hypothetical protein
MALTTLAGLKTAIESANKFAIHKASATAEGAGTWHSLWKTGTVPLPATANPPTYGSGDATMRPTNATLGAFLLVNAGGSNTLYANKLQLNKASAGKIIIYDRLWHCSGLVTNILTTQTIAGSGYPVNRGEANGRGVEIWVEVYTIPGATGPSTWTLNFQDAALGGSSAATYVHPANAETAGQMMPMVMPYGTLSCSYPIDFTCSVSSATAGNVGITLLRPIIELPILLANYDYTAGWLQTALSRIEPNACLAIMVQCTGTSTALIRGHLEVCEE